MHSESQGMRMHSTHFNATEALGYGFVFDIKVSQRGGTPPISHKQGTCNIICKLPTLAGYTLHVKSTFWAPCVLSNSNVYWMATLSTLVRNILHASPTHTTSLRDLPRASAT